MKSEGTHAAEFNAILRMGLTLSELWGMCVFYDYEQRDFTITSFALWE